MTADRDLEAVAAVLGAHRADALTCYDHAPTPEHPVWCCECGAHELLISRSAHLAAALLPLIREREAAAWERALREFADWWEDPANSDELRGLADRHYSIGGPSMPAIVARLRAAANPYTGSEGE